MCVCVYIMIFCVQKLCHLQIESHTSSFPGFFLDIAFSYVAREIETLEPGKIKKIRFSSIASGKEHSLAHILALAQ